MDDDEFDVEAPKSADTLKLLQEAAQLQLAQEQLVDMLEDELSAAKSELHRLRTNVVPELMAQCNSDSFNIGEYDIKLEDLVSGSLPKDPDKRKLAIDWLVEHEHGGMITTVMQIEFGRSQHNEAVDLALRLQEKEGLAPKLASGVHPQTLMAFVRKQLKEGKPVDPEVLGVYVGRIAKASKREAQ